MFTPEAMVVRASAEADEQWRDRSIRQADSRADPRQMASRS
jgi:hypothetical protein